MRLLAVQNRYGPDSAGGTELLLADLIEGLSRRGHETLVLTGRGEGGSDSPGTLHRLLLPKDPHHVGKGVAGAVEWWRRAALNRRLTAAAIRGTGPDLVWIQNFEHLTPSILKAAAQSGVPTVIHCHNHAFRDCLVGSGGREALPARVGILPRRTDLVGFHAVAISGFIAATLADEGFPAGRISVIPNAIPDTFFRPLLPMTPARSRRWLYVGAVSRHKGPYRLVEALDNVPPGERGRVSLDIVGPPGDPAYVESLGELISARGLADVVRLLPPVPRETLPGLLDGHGALFVPSLWQEPFCLAAAEGMARGLAVVASDRGGLPEVVGDAGLLFEPETPGALEAVMRRLLREEDLAGALGAAARVRSDDLFRMERAVTALERVLLEAVAGERAR